MYSRRVLVVVIIVGYLSQNRSLNEAFKGFCEGLSAATKLNTARLINEDIMCTTECTGDCNMMEEITEQMLN